ncbi:MAG TPA: hypothetical protein VK791_00165 [bacterium]|jgi:hypothetical protein|nr:hypothetical protein [bacterium]
MKKFYPFLCLIFLATSLWADDDDLAPEPLSQAAREYESFFQTEKPDPMNHEVWKLYVYDTMMPLDGFTKTPNRLLVGLTATPQDDYRVIISVNQLYNFMRPIPQRGDVIVIDGTVQSRYDKFLLRGRVTDHYFRIVYLYAEGGKILPDEHFTIPSSIPPTSAVTGSVSPTVVVISPVTTQGVSFK